MGGNGPSQFSHEEGGGVTFVKGIRLSDKVIKRMRQPSTAAFPRRPQNESFSSPSPETETPTPSVLHPVLTPPHPLSNSPPPQEASSTSPVEPVPPVKLIPPPPVKFHSFPPTSVEPEAPPPSLEPKTPPVVDPVASAPPPAPEVTTTPQSVGVPPPVEVHSLPPAFAEPEVPPPSLEPKTPFLADPVVSAPPCPEEAPSISESVEVPPPVEFLPTSTEPAASPGILPLAEPVVSPPPAQEVPSTLQSKVVAPPLEFNPPLPSTVENAAPLPSLEPKTLPLADPIVSSPPPPLVAPSIPESVDVPPPFNLHSLPPTSVEPAAPPEVLPLADFVVSAPPSPPPQEVPSTPQSVDVPPLEFDSPFPSPVEPAALPTTSVPAEPVVSSPLPPPADPLPQLDVHVEPESPPLAVEEPLVLPPVESFNSHIEPEIPPAPLEHMVEYVALPPPVQSSTEAAAPPEPLASSLAPDLDKTTPPATIEPAVVAPPYEPVTMKPPPVETVKVQPPPTVEYTPQEPLIPTGPAALAPGEAVLPVQVETTLVEDVVPPAAVEEVLPAMVPVVGSSTPFELVPASSDPAGAQCSIQDVAVEDPSPPGHSVAVIAVPTDAPISELLIEPPPDPAPPSKEPTITLSLPPVVEDEPPAVASLPTPATALPVSAEVVEEELRKKITEEMQRNLEEEISLRKQELQRQLEEMKALAEEEARAAAQAQVEEQVRKTLETENAAYKEKLTDSIMKERMKTEDQKLLVQLYWMEVKAHQLEEKEKGLKKRDALYKEHIDKLEAKCTEFYKVSAESFQKGKEETHNRFARFSIQPVCGDLQSQILKCYKENAGKTLSCSSIASAYMQCVDNAKKNKLSPGG